MHYYKKVFSPVLLTLAVVSAPILADDCGDLPQAPAVIDGASATMEDLVANSQSVKAFIADADAYLDCNEAFVKSDGFKSLSEEEKKSALDMNSGLLDARNNIGEKFNSEVAAYKAANPQ